MPWLEVPPLDIPLPDDMPLDDEPPLDTEPDVAPAPDAPPAPDELLCAIALNEVAASNAPAAKRESILDVIILHLYWSSLWWTIRLSHPDDQHSAFEF